MTDSVAQADRELAEKTFSFCMEHLQEHYSIQFLVARAGVSPTTLKLAYRRIFGMPVFSHIRREKMQWAARELSRNHMRIIDIAAACGYDNASKFSAAFRSVTGYSPREFRMKNASSE